MGQRVVLLEGYGSVRLVRWHSQSITTKHFIKRGSDRIRDAMFVLFTSKLLLKFGDIRLSVPHRPES